LSEESKFLLESLRGFFYSPEQMLACTSKIPTRANNYRFTKDTDSYYVLKKERKNAFIKTQNDII